MENAKAQRVEEFHLPEWETTARHGGEKDIRHKQSVKGRAFIVFDHVMPRDKKYFVCSRKGGCIAISIFLVLLALILGLAIGLGRKTRYVCASMEPKTFLNCSASIKIYLWDHRPTQVTSHTTILVLAPAESHLRTQTTLYPSVTLPLMLYPNLQIQMPIRCVGTS